MSADVYCFVTGEVAENAPHLVRLGRYREVIEGAAFDGRAAVAVLASDRHIAEVVRRAIEAALRECGVMA